MELQTQELDTTQMVVASGTGMVAAGLEPVVTVQYNRYENKQKRNRPY